MIRPAFRAVLVSLCLLLSCASSPVGAVSYQLPPLLDELAMPYTESEVGGIGCIIASVAAGGILTYLVGGVGPIMAGLAAAPLPPARILEGGAAVAFVFSSACYVGVALAPLGMLTYTSILDSFATPKAPPLPVGKKAPASLSR